MRAALSDTEVTAESLARHFAVLGWARPVDTRMTVLVGEPADERSGVSIG